MKKTIITTAVAICVAFALVGCSTTPTQQQVQTEQVLITSAAELGTQIDLSKNPKDAPYFVVAEQVLNTISTSTNQVTVSSVEAALAASGNTNVDPLVTAAIVNGLNIADAFIQNSGTNGIVQSAALKSASGWIATGISEGLQTIPVQQ